jgi:hypothetical protein
MKFESTIDALEWIMKHKLEINHPVNKTDREKNSYDGPICEAVYIERVLSSLHDKDRDILISHVFGEKTNYSQESVENALRRFKNALDYHGFLKAA